MTGCGNNKVERQNQYRAEGIKCLEEKTVELHMLIPFKNGAVLNDIRTHGKILKEDYTAEGTEIWAVMPVSVAEKYKDYVI